MTRPDIAAAYGQLRESFVTRRAAWIRAGLLLLPLAVMYCETLWALADNWWNDPNNSHGLLIPPLALYFAWRKMPRFLATPFVPSTLWGLLLAVGSLLVYFVGRLGAEFFLTRTSGIGLLAGMLLYFFGWAHLRIQVFPLFLLALSIPIPAILFNTVSLPLQAMASTVSAEALTMCAIPVLQEGNVMVLPSTQLGVAEACSGLRSLVSLIALSVILGYLRWGGWGQRLALVLASIPVAMLLNVVRIVITGVIAEQWDVKYAMGFFHEFSGWVVFIAAFAILYGVSALIQRFWPSPPPQEV